jgi:divalent metal cation (Fe/Co/Zn/Cd) transporter
VSAIPVELSPAGRDDRARAVRRALVLNRFTLLYNVIEGGIALTAGAAAGSISLIGFGLDSGIEVSAAVVLAWRLRAERTTGCTQTTDRRATKAIALSFAALALYVGIDAVRAIAGEERPDTSAIGIVLIATSLVVMPALAWAKGQLAPALGSQAQRAEANQTRLCAYLSAVALAGLGTHAAFGWWWADPLAALGIAAFAASEAVRTWRAESLADTCCA